MSTLFTASLPAVRGARIRRRPAAIALAVRCLAAGVAVAGIEFPQSALAQAAAKTDEAAADKVDVTGTRAQVVDSPMRVDAGMGALGSAPVLNTPFSIRVEDQQQIQDRQVNSLQSLFANDASVTGLGGTYSNFADTITVRGLPLDYTNSYKINGLPINNFSGQLPLEVFERVELLKGLSGFMYGFGAPGGIVNYVTKKPTDEPLVEAAVGFRSRGIGSAQADLGGRAGQDGLFGYRVNLVAEYGGLPTTDGRIERYTASGSFDLRLAPTLTLTADLIYNDRQINDPPAPYLNNYLAVGDALPGPISGSTNLGVRNTFEDHRNQLVTVGLNWQFAPQWSARFDVSDARNTTRWIKTLPDLTSSSGNFDAYVYDQAFNVNMQSLQALVQGREQWGGVTHELVLGASGQKERDYRSDDTANYQLVGSSNIFAPVNLSYNSQFQKAMDKASATDQSALFASDRITFDEHWTVLLGVRYNHYESSDVWGNWVPYEKNKATPTAALMYKPDAASTFYASYVQALQGGAVVPAGYVNADQQLPPLVSTQYEIGAKTDQQTWFASAALFRIERAAEYGNAANVYVQDGLEIYQGAEVNGRWLPSSAWDLSGSLMWLSATYDQTDPTAGIDGNRVEATPRFQAALQAAWNAAPGLRLWVGPKYTGNMALNSGNNWTLPAVTLWDAGLSYVTRVWERTLTLRAVVNNVADKKYWGTEGWGGLVVGNPRTFALNAQMSF